MNWHTNHENDMLSQM